MENTKKNVFLTADIETDNERMQEEYENGMEGFDLTKSELEPSEYDGSFESFREWAKDNIDFYDEADKKKILNFGDDELVKFFDGDEYPKYIEKFNEWAEENLSHEELYEVPMMNCLRYYPDFVSFEEEDRQKASGNTTLLYDNVREAWAVGMTGGGMDLSPHLLDTFIQLEKGVPLELAESIRANYGAYVNKERHAENCELLAVAFFDFGLRCIGRIRDLSDTLAENETIKRHLKGLQNLNK